MPLDDEALVRVADAARHLDVPARLLLELIDSGTLHAVMDDHLVLVTINDARLALDIVE